MPIPLPLKLPFGTPIDRNDSIGRAIVGDWRLTEGGGITTYDSARRNNGVLTNEPVWTTGNRGVALSLDGSNDFISTSLTPASNIFTFTIRIFSSAFSAEGHLIECNPYQMWVESTGDVVFYTGAAFCSSRPRITTNQWHELAFVSNGIGHFIYVDGFLATSAADTNACLSPVSSILIGKWFGGFGFNFPGLVDNARVFDRALLPSEILRLYQDPDCYLVQPKRLRGVGFASGGTVYNDSITESLSSSDSQYGVATFVSSASEILSAADALTVSATFSTSLSDTLSAIASETGTVVFSSANVETLIASDSQTNSFVYIGAITEILSTLETINIGSTYNKSVIEVLTLVENLGIFHPNNKIKWVVPTLNKRFIPPVYSKCFTPTIVTSA